MIASAVIFAAALVAFSPNDAGAAHKGLLKTPCIECHTRLPFAGYGPSLRNDAGGACATCHPRHHGNDAMRSHPVNAVPSMRVPPDMILDDQGRIGCITCHAFHGGYRDESGKKLFYLRRTPGKTFCFSCHKKLPGISGTLR